MKRLAAELASVVVSCFLFSQAEALWPSPPKPLDRGWNPEDYGYSFVTKQPALQRRADGETLEPYDDGFREQKMLKPLKRTRVVRNGKKRSLSAADVLYPSNVQHLFWSEDPAFMAAGTVAAINIGQGPHLKRSRVDEEGIVDLDLIEDMMVPNGVQCSAEKNNISLKFREREDYEEAEAAWQFVSQKGNRFVLVVSPPHCEDIIGENREPFMVTSAEFNERNGEIVLKARKIAWGNAIPTFEMLMKQFAPDLQGGTYQEEVTGANRNPAKEVFCDIVRGTLHWALGGVFKKYLPNGKLMYDVFYPGLFGCEDIDISSWEVNLAKLFPFQATVSAGLPFGAKATASFPNGGMEGKLIFDALLRMRAYQIEEFYFKMRPQDVKLSGQMSLSVGVPVYSGWTDPWSKGTIFKITHGLGGFAIPNMFIIGPTGVFSIAYNIGAISANAKVSAPISLDIPNDMIIEFEWDREEKALVNKSNFEVKSLTKGLNSGISASLGLTMQSVISTAFALQLALKIMPDQPLEMGGSIGLTIVPVQAGVEFGIEKSFTCDACGGSHLGYDWGLSAAVSVSGHIDFSAQVSLEKLPLHLPHTTIGISKTLKKLYALNVFSACKGFFEPNTRCQLASHLAAGHPLIPPKSSDWSIADIDEIMVGTENATMMEFG